MANTIAPNILNITWAVAALLAAVAPPRADKTAVIVVPILSPRSTGIAPTNDTVFCA